MMQVETLTDLNCKGVINSVGKSMVLDVMKFGNEFCASFNSAIEAKKAVKNLTRVGYEAKQNCINKRLIYVK